MPSIELVCVEQQTPSVLPKLPFAVRSEPVLQSHRSPSPLFQSDFDRLRGCIYHLGNPSCNRANYEGPFFAYELLSDVSRDRRKCLEFAPEFVASLFELFGILLAASPARSLVFTTDWQFGPRGARRCRPILEGTFWRRHAAHALHLNSLYPIRSNAQRTDSHGRELPRQR